MVNVAILGYGVVGSGVYEVIRKNEKSIEKKTGGKAIRVTHILDLRDFPDHEQPALFTKNFDDIINDPDVSIVVEVMGGLSPAYEYSKAALLAGKNVVTSNKALVAEHGTELMAIAKENNINYLFEASVGGGIPIHRRPWQSGDTRHRPWPKARLPARFSKPPAGRGAPAGCCPSAPAGCRRWHRSVHSLSIDSQGA